MQRTTRPGLLLYVGFTLIELMLVLAVVAILALSAQPAYRSYVERGHQARAQAVLLTCAQLIQRLSLHQFDYLGHADSDRDGLGDTDHGPVAASVCQQVADPTLHYSFSIRAFADSFELMATPNVNEMNAGRGRLSLDHVGLRRWDANDNGEFEADELRWPTG